MSEPARSRRALRLLTAGLLVLAGSLPATADEEPEVAWARLLAGPEAGEEAAAAAAAGETQRYPYLIPRATADRPDEIEGHLVHVIYLLPGGRPDEELDRLGVFDVSMRAQNAWMRKTTGNLQWRLDTFTFPWHDPSTPEQDPVPVEALDVTFIRSSLPGTSLDQGAEVVDFLDGLGFNEPDKRYLSYVASGSGGVCGDARYPVVVDERPSDGKYSQVYLDSTPGCGARRFATSPSEPSYSETIAQQELIHNDSMVPIPAPHNCWVGFGLSFLHVCTPGLPLTGLDPERFDVMFPFAGISLSEKQLDIGDDDYFRHPFPYRDLENSPYLQRVA